MNPNSSRRPFEEDGRFYAGHVKHKVGGKTLKRRCLCFILAANNVVGASTNFSRAEAYFTAQRAANGTLPVPEPQQTRGATLAAVLKLRGFPIHDVRDPNVEIDEETATALGREFCTAA